MVIVFCLLHTKASPDEWAKIQRVLNIMSVASDSAATIDVPPVPASWEAPLPAAQSFAIVAYVTPPSAQSGGWAPLPKLDDFLELLDEPMACVDQSSPSVTLQSLAPESASSSVLSLMLDNPDIEAALNSKPLSAGHQGVSRFAKGKPAHRSSTTPKKIKPLLGNNQNQKATPVKVKSTKSAKASIKINQQPLAMILNTKT